MEQKDREKTTISPRQNMRKADETNPTGIPEEKFHSMTTIELEPEDITQVRQSDVKRKRKRVKIFHLSNIPSTPPLPQENNEIGVPSSIKDAGVDEKTFSQKLEQISENAFDDQCTIANPRYPSIEEIKEMYQNSFDK